MRDKRLLTRLTLCALASINLGVIEVQAKSANYITPKKEAPDDNRWGFIDANTGEIDFENHTESSVESRQRIVLFTADTSVCRIGLNDRVLLETGAADFVTAFGGNDFQCSVFSTDCDNECSEDKALRILPQNGSSFTTSVPPVPEPGPVPNGIFDHVKFLAYSVNTTAPECEGDLSTTWVASGAQLNLNLQPFGAAVSNPNEDARLACFALTVIDIDLLLTFDFIVTNDIVYAIVERLPIIGTTYAAYTYLIPIYKRDRRINPLNDIHKYESRYNRSEGTMTWVIDDRPVFQINEFGVRLNERNAFVFNKHGKKESLKNADRFKILEHDGIDTPLSPINLQTGLAFFTLLDAYRPNNVLGINDANTQALVRLESNRLRAPGVFFYYNPLTFEPPAGGPAGTFVQDSVLDVPTQQYLPTIPSKYRIFGQGAELRLYHYDVSIKD